MRNVLFNFLVVLMILNEIQQNPIHISQLFLIKALYIVASFYRSHPSNKHTHMHTVCVCLDRVISLTKFFV